MPDILTRLHRGSPVGWRSRRCGRSATTSAAGSDYTQDAVEAARRSATATDEIPCDALWLDIEYMDGYRVFTWDTDAFPDVPGMLARLARAGLPGHHDHRPRREVRPRLLRCSTQALERDVLCRTEGGDVYIGQVWPGNTAFPDFVTEEGRAWWGELNAAHVESGLAGIWNDMNEPATGAHPARRDALRPRPASRTSASTTSTRC